MELKLSWLKWYWDSLDLLNWRWWMGMYGEMRTRSKSKNNTTLEHMRDTLNQANTYVWDVHVCALPCYNILLNVAKTLFKRGTEKTTNTFLNSYGATFKREGVSTCHDTLSTNGLLPTSHMAACLSAFNFQVQWRTHHAIHITLQARHFQLLWTTCSMCGFWIWCVRLRFMWVTWHRVWLGADEGHLAGLSSIVPCRFCFLQCSNCKYQHGTCSETWT